MNVTSQQPIKDVNQILIEEQRTHNTLETTRTYLLNAKLPIDTYQTPVPCEEKEEPGSTRLAKYKSHDADQEDNTENLN